MAGGAHAGGVLFGSGDETRRRGWMKEWNERERKGKGKGKGRATLRCRSGSSVAAELSLDSQLAARLEWRVGSS